MKTIRVEIAGPCLLMHNGRLNDPRDPYTRALKVLTSKKKKSDEDHDAIQKAEWNGGLYHDDEIGPFIPGENIQQMLVKGARKAKQGKEFVSVSVEEDEIPLAYDGPRSREDLYAAGMQFVDTRRAGVNGSGVMRTRPRFKDWRLAFTIAIEDDASVNVEDVERALKIAGRVEGVGDFRPGSPKGGRFGRFFVEKFEVQGAKRAN